MAVPLPESDFSGPPFYIVDDEGGTGHHSRCSNAVGSNELPLESQRWGKL